MKFTTEMVSENLRDISGSAIRDIFHLLNKPNMISFAGGNPAISALEPDVIAGLASDVLKGHGWRILQYGATEGFAPLRESICDFVSRVGFTTTPDKVLPTQGAQQALDLLIKATCSKSDTMLVENPTFLGALQTMRTYGVNLVGMESDDDGVIPESVEQLIKRHNPKLIYIIPTFQNPSGKTLPLERRKAIADIANKYGVLVAEDDPYRDLRYTGTALPSIKSFDKDGWVVYMGSFSKLISPGLRVGYAVVDDETLMRKLVIGKQSTDVHSPILNQAIVDAYLRNGLMPGHIEKICANYKIQLDHMLDKINSFPKGVKCRHPEGGLFVWVELPESINATKMLPEAVEKNVAYVPGTHFFFDGGRDNTMRLNFSNSEPEQIDSGMDILGKLIAAKL
ncbi:MAG: PLP-dependent aminotransferase family protein [Clostridia bacterium]|nr:PLP-dependent aminotransferase family protein [Clostridia bacterium]